ncbi:MAG: 3-dehydroquinate synthase [Candidatus Omnitrophota bacterium]
MRVIRVNLKKRSYNIIVGFRLIKSLPLVLRKLKLGTCAYVITNAAIKKRCGGLISKTLKGNNFSVKFKLIPDSESGKSIAVASGVIKDLIRYDKRGRVFIIALGGGVVGDLSGFVASIYKRGIAYVQIPTTLLAQVDSSIGGKTAVDLAEGKNLVGAFYQPRLVLSDIALLKTLKQKQVKSGLAEVIKYAVIKNPQLFAYLEKDYRDILNLKVSALEFIVSRCAAIKAKIVQQDELEVKGLRTVLNFGHTIGHAIEAAQGYKGYTHGGAVGLGMLVACGISRELGMLSAETFRRIENLIRRAGLPLKIKGVSLNRIIKAHYRDKKFSGRRNKFVLIRGIGKTKIVENIPLSIIKKSLLKRIA